MSIRDERVAAGWVTADALWPTFAPSGVPTCSACAGQMTYQYSAGTTTERGEARESVAWWCTTCAVTVEMSLTAPTMTGELG